MRTIAITPVGAPPANHPGVQIFEILSNKVALKSRQEAAAEKSRKEPFVLIKKCSHSKNGFERADYISYYVHIIHYRHCSTLQYDSRERFDERAGWTERDCIGDYIVHNEWNKKWIRKWFPLKDTFARLYLANSLLTPISVIMR